MKKIYVLLDPRDHYTAYVGCSKNPNRRLSYHLSHYVYNPLLAEWFTELKALGLRPLLREIQCVADEDAFCAEREWIGYYVSHNFRVLNLQSLPYSVEAQKVPEKLCA